MKKNKLTQLLFCLLFSCFSLHAQTTDKSKLLTPSYSIETYLQLREKGLHKDALHYLREMGLSAFKIKNLIDFANYLTHLPTAVEFARLERIEKNEIFQEIDSIASLTPSPLTQIANLFLIEQITSNSYLWENTEDQSKLELHFNKIYQHASITATIANPFLILQKHDTIYQETHPQLIDHITEKIIHLSHLQTNHQQLIQLLQFAIENAFNSKNYYAYLEWSLQKFQNEKHTPSNQQLEQLFQQIKFSPAALKLSLLLAEEQLKLGATYHWRTAPNAVNANEQGYQKIATAIKTYPNSLYLNEAQQKLNALEQVTFSAIVHGQLLPNETNLLSIKYKNTDSLFLKVFHIKKRKTISNYTNYYSTFELSEVYGIVVFSIT